MTESTKTQCPYCGVGCGLTVTPPASAGQAAKVFGDKSHPSSQGMICVKGATVAESIDKNRLKTPMIRDSLQEQFRPCTWEEALDRIVNRIQTLIAQGEKESICLYGSGQFHTEDYYIAQKLVKGCLGVNNFDANSRLCMSSAVAAYLDSFGSDGPPCCYDDLELTDCAFLVGTNTAECHPIIFNRLHKYLKGNQQAKLIVVDPRSTKTAKAANLHLAINPGTDIDLFNGIAHLLLNWGAIDTYFIDKCTRDFPKYAEIIRHYPPEIVAGKCGIPIDDLEKAARYWAESKRVLSLWSMGINQSREGTAKARTLINLHLMTANIGKPGAGPFSLTGQPNAMGGREAGGLCHLLPGYRSVKNPQHRAEVEQAWGLPAGQISPVPGRDAWSMITGLETGDVKLLWIAATNPAVSMPDLERTKAALLKSPFTIHQDAYYPTETSAYAHLLLPAAQWGEKTGTMTNSERVVTLNKAFRPPVGQARADWQIFAEVGRRLGFQAQFNFQDSAEVYSEFAGLTYKRPCDMTGINYDRLADTPLQWPDSIDEISAPKIANSGELLGNLVKDNDKSQKTAAKRLYTDGKFNTADGRAVFAAYHSKGLAEPPDDDYPLVLTVGRLYGHWHTQTRTGRIEKIVKMHPAPFLEIHPQDAAKLGIEAGEWVEVRSRRGSARFPALITKAIAPNCVFVPMHWGALWAENAEANSLTHPAACPISLQPELKACAVKLIPLKSLVNAELSPGQFLATPR
ncbi:nitrate reductase [Microcystis wesenbergii FACHB-1317]|uniref:molybdopterin oxidoreductase family protein n=1 Tax=Microcystis TaxID=1125 RepID=UPI0016803814|nr:MULTISPECIES: nitrate reductase [Microcystis]MBD2290313.1 nitrate reductase [Microcystis wesenbergii FACHB-1317]UZO76064.1 nitrate reductase [Microcystis aeruginosa str. Chao 1910]